MTTEIKYSTKEEAITAVTKDGTALQFCSTKLKNDKDVVMAAIKQNSWTFRHASKSLKSNKTFILKALNEYVYPRSLVEYANITIHSDTEVMSLAIEKSTQGGVFYYAKGEVALNKELAAKALVEWQNNLGVNNFGLWDNLHPTLQEFFPRDSWHKKAQSYLNQLEQEKQAEMVSGGSTTEDGVVW